MKSKMVKGKKIIKDEEQIKETILKEKLSGKSDIEIGEKYGVSYKFIERVITQKKGINITSLKKKKRIKYFEPKNYAIENKSVWSFKQRGDWATHSGEYRI